ncbi:MAG: bifunctional diguanylate cyclase/phosphodiesterase, partial [Salinivirgaceae bacterium]
CQCGIPGFVGRAIVHGHAGLDEVAGGTGEELRIHLEGKTDTYNTEYRIKGKDGTYKWFKDKGGIIAKQKNGNPHKIAGIVMDITREKQDEAERQRANQLVLETLEQNPQASTMVDETGVITYANNKAKELFTITENEIKTRTFKDHKWKITDLANKPIEPNDLPFAQIKKNGKPIKNYKHYIQVNDNKKVLLSISGTPIYNAAQEFKGAIFNLHDITETHKTELALKESEAKYRKLFNQNRDAVLLLDKNRTIIDVNEAFLSLFGFDKKEVVKKTTSMLYGNEEDYKKVGKVLTGDEKSIVKNIDYRKKDGTSFIGETGKFSIETEKEKTFVAIIKDVTLKEKHHQQLKIWEHTINSLNEAIILIDENYTILHYNTKFLEIFNTDAQTIKGKKSYEIVHGTQKAPKRCITCKGLSEKKHKENEFWEPNIKKQIRVSIDPVFDKEGNFEFAIEKIKIVQAE